MNVVPFHFLMLNQKLASIYRKQSLFIAKSPSVFHLSHIMCNAKLKFPLHCRTNAASLVVFKIFNSMNSEGVNFGEMVNIRLFLLVQHDESFFSCWYKNSLCWCRTKCKRCYIYICNYYCIEMLQWLLSYYCIWTSWWSVWTPCTVYQV